MSDLTEVRRVRSQMCLLRRLLVQLAAIQSKTVREITVKINITWCQERDGELSLSK
jgi:hypothetical protein